MFKSALPVLQQSVTSCRILHYHSSKVFVCLLVFLHLKAVKWHMPPVFVQVSFIVCGLLDFWVCICLFACTCIHVSSFNSGEEQRQKNEQENEGTFGWEMSCLRNTKEMCECKHIMVEIHILCGLVGSTRLRLRISWEAAEVWIT